MRRATLAVLFFFAAVASTLSAATFERPITDADALQRADLVVIASVGQQSSRAIEGAIVTDYRLSVERTLRGTASSEVITVTELGGALDHLMMIVPGSATYEPGSRVLAFLRQREDGTYQTAYMSAGVLRFTRAGEKEMLVRTQDETTTMAAASDVIDFVLGKTKTPPVPTLVAAESRFDLDTNELASSYTTTADPPGTKPRRPIRWPCDGTPICNLDFVVNNAQSGVPDTPGALEDALGAWSAAAPYLNMELTGLTEITTSTPEGTNAIMLDNSNASPITDCDGAIACGIAWVTDEEHTFDGSTFYTIVDGDVLFRPGAHSQNAFAAFMTHELGHCLGLRHSNDADPRTTDAIMHASPPLAAGASLRQWDEDAMMEVYGPGLVCNPAAITNVSGGGTVTFGSKTTLTVTATGSTPRTYAWFEGLSGDTSVPVGSNSASFQTPNITEEKKYWVKVTNECNTAGAISNTVTVTPTQCTNAEITTEPQSQRIPPGATATLSVVATGTTPLTYAWFEGEVGVTTKKVGSNSNQFKTPALQTSTTYWVRVSNACGTDNSTAAVITVGNQCIPAAIASNPIGGDVKVGAKVTLHVSATGDTPVSFQWYEGESGDTSKPIAGATTGVFEAGPFQSAGTFKYWAKATNQCNQTGANSGTATIVVTCPVATVPVIAAPPVTPNSLPYEVSWSGNVLVTPTFELEEAFNPDFTSSKFYIVSGLKTTIPAKVGVTTDTRVYYRVRAISDCSGEKSAFSNTVDTLITVPAPQNSTEFVVGVPEGTVTPFTQNYLVPGFGATATNADTFSISVDVPWITVFPATGALSAGGTTVQLTINPAGLGTGATIGTISVQRTNAVAGRIITHGSTTSSIPFSLNLVTPISPVPRDTTPPPGTLLIPAVAHADGIGTRFQSDIRIANAASEAITYDISFTPSASDGTTTGKKTTLVINSNETKGLDDVVKVWFGAGVLGEIPLGTLEIRPIKLASGGLPNVLSTAASSRTYAISAAGTLGQFIPALPLSSFISDFSKDPLSQISLQQIAHNDRYRTNLGFTEGSGTPVELLVKLLDTNGVLLKSVPFSLGAYEHRQTGFSSVFGNDVSIGDGRIEVQVTSAGGKATAYASVLDSNTTDPLLVFPVQAGRLSATRYVVPGVAELNAASNFHTDMRLFNPSANPITVSLEYKPQRGDATPVPAAISRTINPGQILAIDNVLPSLWNLNATGGAVTITAPNATPLVATARTFSRESDGGTYGQFIPAVTATDAVGLGERALEILQLEDSNSFRSNVGLVEVTGNPVRIEVMLRPPDAKETGFVEIDLAGGEFMQLGRIFRSFGYTNVYNGRVSLRVISGAGRVAGYGSVVDNRTEDPTYVPTQ